MPFEGLDGIPRSFPAGTALIHEGVAPERVLKLVSGRVKIVTTSSDGREGVLAFRGPGEVLGEMAAIDGGVASATVIAVDDVETVAVTVPAFRRHLVDHPEDALHLLEHLVERLREGDARRSEFGRSDTLSRVAARLHELAAAYGAAEGQGVRIDLPITQEDLAAWVGSSREGVNKALQQLRSLGCIAIERRSITVIDASALTRYLPAK
jgi:CRP/FNR family cyclic AMP-dependent transcriptional regulator